jgi:UDP-glucose 4-epimerase
MKILVTGANGFVGQALCPTLTNIDHTVIKLSRGQNQVTQLEHSIEKTLAADTDLKQTLSDIDVVIHLAGRAHVMQEHAENPYQAYAEVNINATKNLAEQAALNGVKRFIFLSSVKVNGERTSHAAFTELDQAQPEDDYAKTKLEAEKALNTIAKNTKMEVVIIRPPLIYGKGVKANFKNLIKLSLSDIPLPFGAIDNKRSLIYIENLIDFIVLCTHHPKAANQTFLISDDDDISTTQLISYIRMANNQRPWLIPVSKKWLIFILKTLGKSSLSDRLCQNLQVDINKAKSLLGWKPLFNAQEGIARTINNPE